MIMKQCYVSEDVFSWGVWSTKVPPPADANPTIAKGERVGVLTYLPYEDIKTYWHSIVYKNRRYEIPSWCLSDVPPDDQPSTDEGMPLKENQAEATASKGIYTTGE